MVHGDPMQLRQADKKIVHRERLAVRGDRARQRRMVIERFLDEEMGDEHIFHQYRYDVEQMSDGAWVYLLRPARLNKGMDTPIYVERFTAFGNGNDRPPRHGELAAEFVRAAAQPGSPQDRLREALARVARCDEPDDVMRSLAIQSPIAERALKLAKWMFIEQDIAYWTRKGRLVLHAHLDEQITSARPSTAVTQPQRQLDVLDPGPQ